MIFLFIFWGGGCFEFQYTSNEIRTHTYAVKLNLQYDIIFFIINILQLISHLKKNEYQI